MLPRKSHIVSGWRFAVLVGVIILSIAAYFLFLLWGGWNEAIAAFYRVGSAGFAVAIGLSLVNYCLRFLRWQHYLSVLNCRVPWWPSLKIYIAGFALTTTPAKTGEMLRSVFLKDYGVKYHASFGAFLSERLSDLISVLLLSIFGLWQYSAARVVCIFTGIAIVAFLLMLQQLNWMRSLQKWAIRRLNKRLSRSVYFFIKILIAFRCCFSLKTLTIATLLGVLAWGAEGIAFYYLIHLLGIDVTLVTAIFIYAFSLVIGGISFLPGGLGSAEVTMLQLLVWNHASPSDAAVATVVIRLATLWFAVILGLAVFPFLSSAPSER